MNYITIECASELYDIKINSLKTLRYKDSYINKNRFKLKKGQWYILEDYKAPYRNEVFDLYYHALFLSKSENQLTTELSKISGIKKTTLSKYFYRATFTHVNTALNIISILNRFIKDKEELSNAK